MTTQDTASAAAPQTPAGARRQRQAPTAKGKRLLWLLVIPALLSGAAAVTAYARHVSSENLATATKTLAVQNVNVIHAAPGSPVTALTVPGTVQAFSESPVYARINGYLRAWSVDIGAHVRKGELLAVIDAPEVDQELRHARAMLAQAQAGLQLAAVTSARYSDLIKTHSVAQQEVDNSNESFNSQTANVQAAVAEVGRLEQMQGFERVCAPFDGVITARKVDVGDLINSGNGGVGAELFRIAKVDRMRVYVNVPEVYSAAIVPGVQASIEVAALANRRFAGAVARTSRAIGVSSRTLLTEVDVPNPAGELLPGAYAEAHLQIALPAVPLVLPGSAILFQAAGPQVGVVNSRDRVELRGVKLGRDFGDRVEVLSGIGRQDAVIANPPDYLVNGMTVAVQAAQSGGKGE